MILTNYVCSILLIALGLYCVVCKRNVFKIVIGMGVIDYGVNLLIVSIGFNPGGSAPIFTARELSHDLFFVDPVPQALTLTSIVISPASRQWPWPSSSSSNRNTAPWILKKSGGYTDDTTFTYPRDHDLFPGRLPHHAAGT